MQKSIFTWLLIFLSSFSFSTLAEGQSLTANDSGEVWQVIDHRSIKTNARRMIIPQKFKSYLLDVETFKKQLQQAPLEEKIPLSATTATLTLPLPNGKLEDFQFVESPIMDTELSNKYTTIKTYLGVSQRNPLVKVRMDWTDRGFHAMITTVEGTVYIDPYSRGDVKHYMSYYKNDYQALDEPHFECEFKTENTTQNSPDENTANMVFGDCQIRSYRLAVAASGEYSNYHGATSSAQASLVLSAITTTINRVNMVYEVDFGVRLVLIGSTDQVFYYNASTDPFDPNNMGSFLSQNKSNMSSVLGNNSFDIGHAFAQNATNNGLANLAVVCSSSKAGGVTRLVTPEGDPFDIDYVSHEIGHQFGAEHTQNNNCNRSSIASYEPGSASTIMGYAGICSPNVQNNSDAYFHAISVSQVSAHITGSANSCAQIINTGNQKPSVSAGSDYTIPKSTPFALTATATDPDGDLMTYCWEQWDRQVATMPPVSTATGGPAFRSLTPSLSNVRNFPNLNSLVANVTPTWEVLPSVGRDLNFRVTVRDNANGGGCTDDDLMKVTVNANAGPFLVTNPNTSLTWAVGSTEIVNWDVANTTAAPVSCATVDILLSTDGGLTYPVTLANAVANDGSHAITVPNNATTTARVKVVCATNIFFDISNQDFTIEVQDPNLCGVPDNLNASASGNTATLTWNNGVNANDYEVAYKASANTTWIEQTVTGTSYTITNLSTCTSYDFRVKSICTNNSSAFSATFTFDSAGCPTCTDGIQNGNETGIDCGGTDCSACPTCTDGIQNGDETGIDCGGANCPTCPLSYCDSQGNDTSFEYIDAVTIGSINNVSGDDGGYADYTNLNTTVDTDNNYSITLTPGFANGAYNEFWSVYIDYNIDGDFSDAGELVFQGNGSSNVSGNIAIPTTATVGTTRMRIQMQYNSYSTSSCATFTYGEVEDYSLIISTTTPTCNDGIQNGDETGIDCGGANCPTCCPLAGTACDDGLASTENDVEDGNCNCAGTPCPTAGTTCDDGNPSTQNDIEDGNCNCAGTPCPTAGTTCDDGNPSTQNDIEDGNCNCVGTPASGLKIEYGTITNVSNSWQTVTLNNNYNSMVVIASVVLPSNTAHPAVSRIRNASGNSFEVRIQEPGASGSDIFDIHYVVAEEGVYTAAQDGIKMEAIKANSSATANSSSWVREQRLYNNSYSNPVVVGQVMSYNDVNWSVFWASIDNARSVAPGPGNAFACGKEVAEDPNSVRADETIGYIILEAGAGDINGLTYSAGVGNDIIRGVGNTSVGYNYSVAGLSSIDAAVVSVAGMDGGNGGWPTLFGATQFSGNQLTLAFDEDQVRDNERNHTTEQTAYLAFGTSNASRAISTNEVVKNNAQLQVFPNPAMDHATIQYIVAADGFAQIELYDLMGRKVQTLVQAAQSAGKYTLPFENSNYLEGVYLLVFTINEEQVIKKLVFKRPQ